MAAAAAGGAAAPVLGAAAAARVALVARVAARLGIETYLVGGTVRDLLLGRPQGPDLDFVVVGGGGGAVGGDDGGGGGDGSGEGGGAVARLAEAVARETGGRVVRHAVFLTADVVDGKGFHMDMAAARRETYRAVAALPEVSAAATLAEDLWRRDFTVNALALPLPLLGLGAGGGDAGAAGVRWVGGSEATGTSDVRRAGGVSGGVEVGGAPGDAAAGRAIDVAGLVDVTGGAVDLAAGALRVLHERSFLDDPTRVLRGVRFEVRLGFRFTADTEALARQAVAAGAFGELTGSRLRHELELLLDADGAIGGLERLADLGVLAAAVHPRLTVDAAARRRLAGAALEAAWHRAAVAGAPGGGGGGRGAGGEGGSAGGQAAGGGRGQGAWDRAAGGGRSEGVLGGAGSRRGAGDGGAERTVPRTWLVLLMALVDGLAAEERVAVGERLLLAGDERRLVAAGGERAAAAAARLGRLDATAGEVDGVLHPLAAEERIVLAAGGGAAVRAWVRRYETELRPLGLTIGGADLLAAGAEPGPAIGRALRATRAARLDGEVGPGGELEYALAQVAADVGRPP